ncbi:hypothetical protein MO867_17480 [Microbulbifer sp. OS29]|uniref:Uncharacterized protein n=1 Tax=Microbulbifer okhotskensis TaxID=2926617 RepID=A0A9X2EUJ6_9GAMM|nr:hypothetical protein [Microbulbifer okhotskensis]MCO1336126.1 hypothetical protein [Microbulbifer okhotskensis]
MIGKQPQGVEQEMSGHSLRVRKDRWEAIEKKAWQLSMEAKKPIKPTDVADAILFKGLKDLKLEDIELAKKTR